MNSRTETLKIFAIALGLLFFACATMLPMLPAIAQEQGTTSEEGSHATDNSGQAATERETLSSASTGISFFGLAGWKWIGLVIFGLLSYLVSGWLVKLLKHLNARRRGKVSAQVEEFLNGPIRFLLVVLLFRMVLEFLTLSPAARGLFRSKTLVVLVVVWTLLRAIDLLHDALGERFRLQNQEAAMVLLRPLKGLLKICLIILGVFLWLDNIGVNITTLIAGFGVGGAALALAAQDTLRNFFGSVMIFLDKPFVVGQRIVTSGYDGIVESIGVRSTKLRLLNGHQAVIANDVMARANIENISRRPYLRRHTNIKVAPENSLEQLEKALEIIQQILENHDGMQPDSPPRVYFNEFNGDSYNIMVIYWYHPPDYWAFNAFNQTVNIRIAREFEKEGIQFAWPSITNFLAQHPEDIPLQLKKGE